MSEDRKRELDAQISAAFRSSGEYLKGETYEQLTARNAQAARDIYALTRELGLERQLMADAPAWKAPAGIALNAFARRYYSGIMREEAEALGFAVPANMPRRVVPIKRARKAARTACPHCGGSLKEAA